MNAPRHAAGFSLIEILVSLVVLALGLLGFAALQVRASTAEVESYQRVQALILLQDMADRIHTNRKVASCYVTATPLGTGYAGTPACVAGNPDEQTRAVQDLTAWNALLQGAAEVKNGSNVGAMIDARGCVEFDAATNQYTITVVWQGMSDTAAPPSGLTCGQNLYGAETRRRAVSTTLAIPDLT